MRLAPFAALVLCSAAFSQTLVDPAQVPAVLGKFATHAGASLPCRVDPVGPGLNYAFRFRAGYSFRIPMAQFSNGDHSWYVLTRVTSEGSGAPPAYLLVESKSSNVAIVDQDLRISGSYLLGQGRYRVEATLLDDRNRSCRGEWQVEARLASGEKAVRPALPPFAVREYRLRGASQSNGAPVAASPRLTVLLNAAPLTPRRTTLRESDRNTLLDALTGLVERMPARAVRLVVFNLEQQKELLREEHFTLSGLDGVADTIEHLQLAAVDVHLLAKPLGHVSLLTDLVNQEIHDPHPSGAVVILGPLSRYDNRIPNGALERPAGTAPRFFYVQYQEPARLSLARLQSLFNGPARGLDLEEFNMAPRLAVQNPNESDLIDGVINRLKGRTLPIHNPAEYARAIEQIERKR